MIADRVKEATSTTGTGNLSLLGATAQFQSFNTAFGTNTPFYYVITDANGADWEVGTGQLTNATTLQRTTVHQSSNADAKINLSSGTHTVFCAAPEVFLFGLAPKSGKLSQFAATTSAELAGVISDETGSGSLVFATSPSLTTPNIGTPSAGTLTNCTGLPVGGVSGLGTGVATALAVNTGSSGAFVVNGGALGTPSSGTVTNLTGTASININGTVGATTPNTGSFTTLSASGVATFSAGTVTAPAITTSGDTNNGIYFPATDATAITTAGVERLRVDSSGNVGIGTSSVVSSARLQVTASDDTYVVIKSDGSGDYSLSLGSGGTPLIARGSGAPLAFGTVTNGTAITSWSEQMRIDSSGNVGIGTSSPFSTARLQVKTGTNKNFGVQTGTTDTSGIKLNVYNDAADTNIPIEINGSVFIAKTGETERMRIDSSGNVIVNTAAVATSATAGFLWIPSCAGAPTGAPTAPYTNAAALVADTTNNRLYVLVAGTWKYASLT